jgi:hypothetical protein
VVRSLTVAEAVEAWTSVRVGLPAVAARPDDDVRTALTELIEVTRWRTAQLRSAFTGCPPRYDGDRPDFPPSFYRAADERTRNRLVAAATAGRPLPQVVADADVVLAGLLSWMGTLTDDDLQRTVGIDPDADQRPPSPDVRWFRLAEEHTDLVDAQPLGEWLVGWGSHLSGWRTRLGHDESWSRRASTIE